MKVCDVIAALKDYPPDAEVFCMREESNWGYSEDRGSFEVIECNEAPVECVERFDHPFTDEIAVKIC